MGNQCIFAGWRHWKKNGPQGEEFRVGEFTCPLLTVLVNCWSLEICHKVSLFQWKSWASFRNHFSVKCFQLKNSETRAIEIAVMSAFPNTLLICNENTWKQPWCLLSFSKLLKRTPPAFLKKMHVWREVKQPLILEGICPPFFWHFIAL